LPGSPVSRTAQRHFAARVVFCILYSVFSVGLADAEVRVQDIARLQGQRTNKLMGYGLVVGLPGTGDGEKYLPTMRALARMHQRYHAPILADSDIKGNRSVALVSVEAVIPELGAREGQPVDVVISAIGSAKNLRGGQLLTTPLQYAMFDEEDPASQHILALASGTVGIPDDKTPTRGVIRDGAVLEEDFLYAFIQDGTITLVLNDTHAGWTWAHLVARAINHELSNPAARPADERVVGARNVSVEPAVAVGPKNIVVHIPAYELASPARFISRVQQTALFDLPEPAAVVTINRTTKNISFTGSVRVSPTVLQIPGVGAVRIGGTTDERGPGNPAGTVGFSELFDTLSAIKVTPDQLMDAIEHLHQTGTLHAQLRYK
jgi:flagellar P-ring protein precursor FlgI